MKALKTLALVLGAVALASSALATPTLVLWDTGGFSSGPIVPSPLGSGIATYINASFDSAWTVVISTTETKPAIGSALNPKMDINIQATSLGVAGRDLHVSWSDDAFGPLNASLGAQLTAHVVSGTGAPIEYQTYYHAGAGVWSANSQPGAPWTLFTDSGALPAPTYNDLQSGSLNQSSFGLTEYVTITSSPGGSYSVDASIQVVPEPSTTMLLLGAAVSGLPFLRRKLS